MISSLQSSIQNLTIFVDEYHSKWYNDALNLVEEVDIKESDIKNLEFSQARDINQISQLKPLKIISELF